MGSPGQRVWYTTKERYALCREKNNGNSWKGYLMAGYGQTVRILFLDGQERLFTKALVDLDKEGWLHITHLQVKDGPISGIAEPIAGYRREALKGWEYVEGKGEDTQTDTSVSG
jgi:hypothetical protein